MTTFTPLKQALQLQAKVTLTDGLDWNDMSTQIQASISVDEFVSASSSYPIFFIKNSHSGSFSAIALLGLQQDNIFFTGEESNDIAYIPNSLSMLPFALGADPDNSKKLTTCINLQSQLVNQSEGSALLNEDNTSSERLKQVTQEFSGIFQQHVSTEQFISVLIECNLLMELELNIQCSGGENTTIQGLYLINEQQLNSLTAEQQLLFLERGFYPPIMAMLASTVQINRMIKLYKQKKMKDINSVNMKVV